MNYRLTLVALALFVGAVVTAVFAGGEESTGALVTPLLSDEPATRYLARIELNKPEEIEEALKRAESFYFSDNASENRPPVVFVLHGPEVAVFQKRNYKNYKSIVDLAARLTAFEVVDIRICQTQLRAMKGSESDLYPFVGSVPYGLDEIARLMEEEGFSYF